MSGRIGTKVKAVLFDHDDTLVGTIEAKSAQHKHVAKQFYNKDLTDEEIKAHWGKPLQAMAGLLYDTKDIDYAMEKILATHQSFPKHLYDDTLATLRTLKQAGKKLGVITSTVRFSLEYDLKNLKIPKSLFDYTQTAEDTNFHKPDPRVFDPVIAWLRDQSIKPDEVVYVGDGLQDMKAALGAGFKFIGVGTGFISPRQFNDEGAESVEKLSDLVTQ